MEKATRVPHKLTVTIDEAVVEPAKIAAIKRKTSLGKIVEDALRRFAAEVETEEKARQGTATDAPR